jgi:hypothetical protein
MYTNAQYVYDEETEQNTCIKVEINGKVSDVPLDENNSDYAEIMRQVAAGELTIADAE